MSSFEELLAQKDALVLPGAYDALSARVAVVSGRNVIGIELPNQTREKVYLRELLAADEYAGFYDCLVVCTPRTKVGIVFVGIPCRKSFW